MGSYYCRRAERQLPVASSEYSVVGLAYWPSEVAVESATTNTNGRTKYQVLVPSTAVCISVQRSLPLLLVAGMPVPLRSTRYPLQGVVFQKPLFDFVNDGVPGPESDTMRP